ncbi:response regulator transcription factor [Luteitalea sp.]|uniref:response regulator n=1 Tax=Luteitalea sp. TaxID=2004800 RepID=UPI0025BE8B77|nr:response regulator transcription factor [Luteitalea sp.]
MLVDDHRVVTRSLQAYLESFDDLTVVGVASSGEEALDHVDEWKPDVVLQDLLLPGGIDGIETTRRLLARRPGVKVIALTALVDEPRMMAVLRAGALGYVRKDADPEVLLAAVRRVAAGRPYIDPGVTTHLMHAVTASDELTAREVEVMRELARGRSNKEIAVSLAISEETIKTHVGHVLAKLQADNRTQALVQALKRGLIALEELE